MIVKPSPVLLSQDYNGGEGANACGGEFARGWQPLLGCMLGLAAGVHSLPFYTTGLFMVSLGTAFGWNRAQVSLAPTLLTATIAITAPFVGAVIDRYGERKPAMFSLIFVVIGFVALSYTAGNLTFFYATFGLMALAGAGSTTPTWTRMINRTFRTHRGAALGIGLIGSGLASVLSPILLTSLITHDGWQAGYRALAITTAIATVLIAVLTRRIAGPATAAAEASAVTGMTTKEALQDPVFWQLAGAFLLVAIASPGLIVHLVPLLVDGGLTAMQAAAFASAIGLTIIVARLISGLLLDVFFAPYVAAVVMALSASGVMVLALGGPAYGLLGAIAVGLSFGAEFDLVAYMCARYFGLRSYGRLYGLLYAVVLAGTSTSPLIYGLARGAYGSYKAVLLAASVTLLASAFIFLTMPRFARGSDDRRP